MRTPLRTRAWALVTLCVAGCASIPAEAVELSEIAARRTADMQASHEAMLSAYFQSSRDRVEDFLQHRWIPTFLGRFVETSRVMDDLREPGVLTDSQRDRLVIELAVLPAPARGDPDAVAGAVDRALGDPARGRMILEFSQAALHEIHLQRRELIGPIDEMERKAIAELRAAYADLIQMQSTLTAFIRSARDVSAEEDRVLRRLGVLSARDRAVEAAVVFNESVRRIAAGADHADEVLRQLRNTLGVPVERTQP